MRPRATEALRRSIRCWDDWVTATGGASLLGTFLTGAVFALPVLTPILLGIHSCQLPHVGATLSTERLILRTAEHSTFQPTHQAAHTVTLVSAIRLPVRFAASREVASHSSDVDLLKQAESHAEAFSAVIGSPVYP